MGFLFELDTPVIVALVVSFYVAAGGQLRHVLFLSTRRGARPVSLVKLYEVLLFVHLLLAAATANSVQMMPNPPAAGITTNKPMSTKSAPATSPTID